MAFENVSVVSLKSAINSCKQSINYSVTNELISNISSGNVWNFSAKNNLKNALNILCNTRYKDLIACLDKCSTVATYIEQYKEKELEIKGYQSQISNLTSKISCDASGTINYVICSGDTLSGIASNFGVNMDSIVEANGFTSSSQTIYVGQTIVIPGVDSNYAQYQSQINDLKNKISKCQLEMENLEYKVYSIIG